MNTYTCGNLGVYFDGGIKICLVMLIHHSTQDILPSLESVAKYIDFWVIYELVNPERGNHCDLIFDFFRDHRISGAYRPIYEYHPPYYTIEEALIQHAWGKSDYLLFMKDYEMMVVRDPRFKQKLTADSYIFPAPAEKCHPRRLIHSRQNWKNAGLTARYPRHYGTLFDTSSDMLAFKKN